MIIGCSTLIPVNLIAKSDTSGSTMLLPRQPCGCPSSRSGCSSLSAAAPSTWKTDRIPVDNVYFPLAKTLALTLHDKPVVDVVTCRVVPAYRDQVAGLCAELLCLRRSRGSSGTCRGYVVLLIAFFASAPLRILCSGKNFRSLTKVHRGAIRTIEYCH